MKFFKEYIGKGLIKGQKPSFGQISKQMVRAHKDIKVAIKMLESDSEWAATIAYQAMLRAGRALIFANGYLPADGQQHKTVVELTGLLTDTKFSSLISQFNRLRKKRNVFFYDSDEGCTQTEAKTFISVAKELISVIGAEIKRLSPQKSFEF